MNCKFKRSKFNAVASAKAINTFRISLGGNSFTKEQILDIFRECNLPTASQFWSLFRRAGIVKRINHSQFTFTSDSPVYFGLIETIYNKFYAMNKKYSKNNKAEDIPVVEVEECTLTVEGAINFLKEKGYKILAPVGVVYQII